MAKLEDGKRQAIAQALLQGTPIGTISTTYNITSKATQLIYDELGSKRKVKQRAADAANADRAGTKT